MRPNGSPKELEARRMVAMRLLKQVGVLHKVAHVMGCHPSSVMRWRDALLEHGIAGLKAKPVPGRPPKLTPRQSDRLIRLLLQGAMSRGYANELWTTQRIADVIWQEFGVRYDRDYVGTLMHRLNWSHQRPERRALERDEKKIERWKQREWPRIKRGLNSWGPTSSS